MDFYFMYANPAAMGDCCDAVMKGIVELQHALIGSGRRLVEFGGEFHIQGLMGSLGIKFFDKGVKLFLLLEEVITGWFGGFFFKRQVHAFMAAIFLRVARFDPFYGDAESEPPNGEPAHSEECDARSKGLAIVRADSHGKSKFFEGLFKDVKSS